MEARFVLALLMKSMLICVGEEKGNSVLLRKMYLLFWKKDIQLPMVKEMCISATVRCQDCDLLVSNDTCSICLRYEAQLRPMYAYFVKKSACDITLKSKTNLRHLSTPQRLKKNKLLKSALLNQQRKIKRLHMKLDLATATIGIEPDEALHNDMLIAADDFQSRD